MALVLNDRVKETTTTTGTGAFTLAGAVTGFETFGTGVGNSNTTYYAVTLPGSAEFEVGLGTLSSDSSTLARTTVISSSNSDNAVDFSAGTKTIFCTLPASKTVFLDSSGNIVAANASNLTALNASNLSSGTVPNARLDAQLQDVAGLAVTNGGFIVGDGANFVLETGVTARTSLGLGTVATLDTGISNTNVAKFTSGVVDNDFLRVDGTSIEGRSASEVLSDIGGQASLTFGISNTNIPIFTTGVADDDFLRVAGTSIEGRSASEVLSDIGGQAALTFGISNTNAVKIDSASVADDEYARFTANGLESRSTAEVLSDIGGITASSTDTLTNKTIDADGTGNNITNIENANIKASAAIDATKIADGSVTSAEFQYLGSVTSDIQTQLDAKASKGLAVAMAIAL